jgi:glycosyltransferase involved in cell wall biosynthesis
VVPNIHRDEPAGLPFEQREGILFVGNYSHQPNRDAVRWMVEEILPLVREEIPEVVLHLVGSGITEEITALAGDGVIVHGWVPTIDEMYRRVRLSVAPLRYGAGMKGKVGESMAFGVPVVATPIGAEGMGLSQGHDVLIAEDAAGLARSIVTAYGQEDLWGELAANGRETISVGYSPAMVRRALGSLLAELGVPVPR